jgi:hypothetical protein
VNDFKEFKNIDRMMYAPCVIIADFEADNKKCNESYGRKIRKIMKQKANSFCYIIHWINTDEIWGLFIYREENAMEEFVCQIDEELKRINEVLEVKEDHIVTEYAKRKFKHVKRCWICKKEFI